MKYHGYEIDPSFIVGGAIKWHVTGCGEFVLGTRDGCKYFIKRNMHIRFPSKGDPKAVYDKYKAESDAVVDKQNKLRKHMSGLTWHTDHIVAEIENFRDEENMFTTVTVCIPDALPDNFDYSNLSFAEFLALSKEFAVVLKKLHACGVIHGDLKEKNILVVNKGGKYTPYLIDFDSSYIKSEIPAYDCIGGTEGYQSPEIILYGSDEGAAESSTITTATDIFTMAVVMHRWWTGAFPSFDLDKGTVGAAVYLEKPVTISKKFDVKIGDNCGATLMSLINWMLTKDSKSRPTAEQVLAVLSDKMEVPEEYHKGSDEKPFDKELWPTHKLIAELYTVATLKKKGVKSFKRVNTGCGSKGLQYQISTGDGATKTLSVDELISSGYARAVVASVDTPWDEHDIEFVSPAEVSAKGYCKIVKTQMGYRKKYIITTKTGMEFDKSYEWLVSEGLAKVKVYDVPEVDKPWPEHGRIYLTENMAHFGVKSISRVEVGGEHRYKIVYHEIIDGKNKVHDKVSGNNLKIMGFIQ